MKINLLNSNKIQILLLVILSYFFFMFGNSVISLTNPDEVFYAQIAKEMARHRSWVTPYLFDKPNFEKPILLYWLLRLGFIVFGVSGFAARFFPAVFAALGVVAVYCLGLLGFGDRRKAFLSALLLMSSGFYIGLGRTVFTDMVFSVWILIALLSFFWGYVKAKRRGLGIILFFVSAAFAVLTKGPLGIIIPALIVIIFLWLRRELGYLRSYYTVLGILIFAALAFPWYFVMISRYGSMFTHEFFYNDHIRRLIEAEHKANDTWYFYPFSMVGCMFPWSLFVPAGLFSLRRKHLRKAGPVYPFLACWILVVFVLFQAAHSKLTSYILPLFPALALLIGEYLQNSITALKNRTVRVLFILTWLTFILLPIALTAALIMHTPYITTKTPLYFFIFLFSCLLLLMLRFILRSRFLRAIALTALFLPALLLVVPFVKNDVEPYTSPKLASEYLVKNADADSVILCSRFFVRGVRYYTDRKVVAMGNNCFSPHPIPFLDTDDKVRDFLRGQSVTYCVLNKSSLEDIKRVAQQGFKLAILKTIGNEYIVKIQP